MKTIYCASCLIKVAEIESGSKIKAKAVMLCDTCEMKRISFEMMHKPRKYDNFMDSFWGMIK